VIAPPSVVMIGLDAFDPGLARRFAAAGHLPTLARLLDRGAQSRVVNPFGLFVGALWVSCASGQRVERHGFHCWEEIEVATYDRQMRYPRPDRYDASWKQIGDAGSRVAAIDVPHSRAPARLNGIEIAEWGCHDRHFGFHTCPAPRARALEARFGLHPVLGADAYGERHFAPDDVAFRAGFHRSADEDMALLQAMIAGVRTKGEMLSAILAEEPWDLFLGVFGEAHAIGHQQWHLHDPDHPRFDAALRDAMGGDPILQVYREIDAALGRLIERAPSGATILIHLSHGMGAHHDGTHLLDEVLARLDRIAAGKSPRGGVLDRARHALRPAVNRLGAMTLPLPIPPRLRRKVAQAAKGTGPASRAHRFFFQEPNNSVYGGVRLNLAGREPRGRVRADEADRLLRSIEEDLRALVNVDTGRAAVVAVTRAADHFDRKDGDTMPDLFIEWDRAAPIETLASPKIGTVHRYNAEWRTGDHFPDGLLLASGSDFPAGRSMPPIAVEDIGPSVAARLGVALENVDGKPVSWLAGEGEAHVAPASDCPALAFR
jgi:predicted AlkP superfamily phosphohydrolase/phosphomutase